MIHLLSKLVTILSQKTMIITLPYVFYFVQQYAEVRCLRTMLEVKKANLLNLAFIKLQKSVVDDYFWFESCIEDDKKRVLGFDKNGAPLKTTEVEPGSKESLLDSHLVDIEESWEFFRNNKQTAHMKILWKRLCNKLNHT